MSNKLIIAAAGSGKTTYLIKKALELKDSRVLITTYTEANEAEIRKKIKILPANITVQTWFSFLLQHGVKPYQGHIVNFDIKGMHLVSGQSAQYIKEDDIEKHYFDKHHYIYSDKISKLLLKCNSASGGKVLDRLSRIYSHIFIDEVQDLAGYDLEFLKLLFNSKINMMLVGDPRQGTYSTSNVAKNKKFKKSEITHFFEDESIDIKKDDNLLIINYRSIPSICDFSNLLFPQHSPTSSGNTETTDHDGIFIVRPHDADAYVKQYRAMQLRDSRRKVVDNEYPIFNFGESKGLSFDRILIYPTEPIIKWLKNSTSNLAPTSRSKLYVAITRARYSVAFVYDFKDKETFVKGINKYSIPETVVL